jgi:F-type H+-transporting ATPase subunit gamma
MASLKDIQRKIGAVKKTQQITRAMNMVAAAKLRVAQARMENFRPYAAKYADLMSNLAQRIEPDIHPFLVQPEEVNRIELAAFSSDRGLCGSFNSNMITAVEKFYNQKKAEGVEVTLTLVSRRMKDYFRRREINVREAFTSAMTSFDYFFASQLASELMDLYLEGEVQEVWIYYTHFYSMASQRPRLVKLLPFTSEEEDEATGDGLEYLCEPSVEGIMMDLLPKSVAIQVYNAMLETSTSEHAARMTAMDNATKNCKELIQDLTLAFNKARQAAITLELMDIVGGAEALKS